MRFLQILGALLALSLPAQAQQAKERACLQRSQISDFHPGPGNRSLIVTDRSRRIYQVNFQSTCFVFSTRSALSFREFAQNRLSCLAKGDEVESASAVGSGQSCRIESVEFYRPQREEIVRPREKRNG